jgi:hypothetical protein
MPWSKSKFHNKITEGYHSKAECKRAKELALLLQLGHISELKEQFPFPMRVNGQHICKYIVDFIYFDNDKKVWVAEDVKGCKTDVYRLKAKLFQAIYGDDWIFFENTAATKPKRKRAAKRWLKASSLKQEIQ